MTHIHNESAARRSKVDPQNLSPTGPSGGAVGGQLRPPRRLFGYLRGKSCIRRRELRDSSPLSYKHLE